MLLAMCLMLCVAGSLGSTAFAEGEEPAGHRTSAVPVSQTENDINGRHILTKIFEVNPGTDPETLKEDGMEVGGYRYELISITKETDNFEDTQTVSVPQSLALSAKSSDAAYREAVANFAPSIEYDQDGYIGELYLDNSSIEVSETGRQSHKGSDGITKTYTMAYNDDSQIPSTVTQNGKTYSRSSISWSDGEYGADGVMPENYVATVRYTRSYTYSTVDGYQATANYAGEVMYKNASIIRYKVEYLGTPIGAGAQVIGAGTVGSYYIDANGNYIPVPDVSVGNPTGSVGISNTMLIVIISLVALIFLLALGVSILVTLMITNNKRNRELMRLQANQAPVMLLPGAVQTQSPQNSPVQAEPVQTQDFDSML